MSSTSVTTSNGQVIVSTDDGTPSAPPAPPGTAIVVHRDSGLEAGIVRSGDDFTVGMHSQHPLDTGSFVAGLMLGLLLYFIVQTAMRWHARREARGHARAAAIGPRATESANQTRMMADVAALARRTATLETIVTDPAQRTLREIEALR